LPEIVLRQRNETAVRERILEAAFAAFMESGYATTSESFTRWLATNRKC